MLLNRLSLLPLLFFSGLLNAQTIPASPGNHGEQLPQNTPKEMSWWNLLHYGIAIHPDYNRKFLVGTNEVTFTALQTDKTLQIDLQEPMHITKVTWKGAGLAVEKKDKGVYLITFPRMIKKGETQDVVIHFKGEPKESLKPPYDSGWIWAKDEKGRPWISVACEGSGASIWLPCKDVLYDEPDNGVSFSITVPDTLTAVANGRLKKKSPGKQGTTTYTWKVVNPINNYNIIPYIGKYVSWHQNYAGLNGKLDCAYWVLDYSLAKAKNHFKQTDTLLSAFEYWAGPYPFYEDSYKLVEAPMSGMEHQSALAYGNGFQNGLNGKDIISKSGWGLKFDFVLVHESGHEWFGNSITASTGSDSWIHEGFTKYLETLYTSYVFGIEAGNDYAVGTWKRIKNDEPVLGTTTTDQYYKGGAMLHTIRQILGDSVFHGWLRGLNQRFYHQTVNTGQVLAFLNQHTKRDFSKVFAQYLQTTQVPVFEYFITTGGLHYRWNSCVEGFDMPLNISVGGKQFMLIMPSTQWQKQGLTGDSGTPLSVDRNFYVQVKQVSETK